MDIYIPMHKIGNRVYSKGTGSSNLPLSARNFEPTGNSGFFLFGMSFIPADTVQGYIWSSSCHLSGYLLTPGTVPT